MIRLHAERENHKRERDACTARALELSNQKGIPCTIITDERKYLSSVDMSVVAPLGLSCVADLIRFRIGSTIPDALYIDDDLYLKDFPSFDLEGRPYFSYQDVFMFYVNNCCSQFKTWLERRERHIMDRLWYFTVMRFAEETYVIPESYYVHGWLTNGREDTHNKLRAVL